MARNIQITTVRVDRKETVSKKAPKPKAPVKPKEALKVSKISMVIGEGKTGQMILGESEAVL